MIMKQQLVKKSSATFVGVNRRQFITIHETGNTRNGAGARAHADLQVKGFGSSWHWQVDDQIAIQSFPHTVQCWHAGDGRGTGNLQSIAIEICVNGDSQYKQAVINAAKLTKHIMAKENIPLSRVVQHHHWSRKDCPHFLRSGHKGIDWHQFKQLIEPSNVIKAIQFGQTGTHVKQLQKDLNRLHYKLVVDGSFGPLTQQAVKYFQAMHQLDVDGSVGPKTKDILAKALLNPKNVPIQVLSSGQGGKAVGQLQLSLNKQGEYLAVDHSYGPQTILAVRRFQGKKGIKIDGIVQFLTWEALKNTIFQ